MYINIMRGVFTRKQLWRKCIIYRNINNNNMLIPNNNNNNNNNNIKVVPVKKKVTFNNTVYLTLIPTKEELKNLLFLYESKNLK